jgi:hypothetical protein
MRILVLLSFFLAAAFPMASAQQCTTSVAVNAFDAQTKAALHGLTAADFEATARSTNLHVVSVEPVFRNRVLILVDHSGQENQDSLRAVADLVSEAPPGMPVAFGVFAQEAVFTPGFIAESDQLRESLDAVLSRASHIGSRPALAKALMQALDAFGAHRPGDTILLVSHSRDQETKSSMDELRSEFRRRGTRLQLLMGLLPTPGSRHVDAGQIFSGWNVADSFSDDLVRLANSTGGVLMGFMNSEWLQSASSGYMLSITTPVAFKKALNWSLRLRDSGNDVPPADLFYPAQLTPCSMPQIAALSGKAKPRP